MGKNFTTFSPLRKILEKSPSAHPWKKSFGRPWAAMHKQQVCVGLWMLRGALLQATGQNQRCIYDENYVFQHPLLWQRISFEAQRIDCGVVAKSRHALNAASPSTETGWMVNFIASLKTCRALKSVQLIGNATFYPVNRQKYIPMSDSKQALGYPVNHYPDNTTLIKSITPVLSTQAKMNVDLHVKLHGFLTRFL